MLRGPRNRLTKEAPLNAGSLQKLLRTSRGVEFASTRSPLARFCQFAGTDFTVSVDVHISVAKVAKRLHAVMARCDVT